MFQIQRMLWFLFYQDMCWSRDTVLLSIWKLRRCLPHRWYPYITVGGSLLFMFDGVKKLAVVLNTLFVLRLMNNAAVVHLLHRLAVLQTTHAIALLTSACLLLPLLAPHKYVAELISAAKTPNSVRFAIMLYPIIKYGVVCGVPS